MSPFFVRQSLRVINADSPALLDPARMTAKKDRFIAAGREAGQSDQNVPRIDITHIAPNDSCKVIVLPSGPSFMMR